MEYAENNDKTPSLNREGWGGSPVGGTLVAPVTPSRRGCQPFKQRRCGTRAPLNRKNPI